jgi:hypothetical protein
MYVQITSGTNGYSLNSSFDTAAEWVSTIDANGVAVSASEVAFTDISVNSALALASLARSSISLAFPAYMGINHPAQTGGDYGAYQYPTQAARPATQVQQGSWRNQANGTTNLHQAIDEAIADDADYVENEVASGVLIVSLSSVLDPSVGTDHNIFTRYSWQDGSGDFTLTLTLREGATTRATKVVTVTADYDVKKVDVFTLTSTQANNITNYANLRLGFQVTATIGDELVYVHQAFLEVPTNTGGVGKRKRAHRRRML